MDFGRYLEYSSQGFEPVYLVLRLTLKQSTVVFDSFGRRVLVSTP